MSTKPQAGASLESVSDGYISGWSYSHEDWAHRRTADATLAGEAPGCCVSQAGGDSTGDCKRSNLLVLVRTSSATLVVIQLPGPTLPTCSWPLARVRRGVPRLSHERSQGPSGHTVLVECAYASWLFRYILGRLTYTIIDAAFDAIILTTAHVAEESLHRLQSARAL
jgi:hypothetical protein